VTPAIAFILDAPRFAAMEEDKRRRFLFELIGISASIEDRKERLLKRGCRPDLVDTVLPIMRSGFDAAHKFAEEKQAEYRASWKALTNEAYGSQKAEGWRAPLTGAEVNREQITGLQNDITRFGLEIKDLTKQIGAGEAYLQHKARYDKEAKGLRDSAQLVGKRKKDVEQAERSVAAHRPVVEKAEAALADARLKGQPCPSCGTVLAMRPEGKLIEAPAPDKKALVGLEQAVETARSTMRVLQETFTKASSDYDASTRAAEILAQLESAMATPTTPENLAAMKKQSVELEHEIESFTSKLDDLQKQVREIDAAKKTTDAAAKAHQLVLAWGVLAEALAPDGVPGDLLKEALGPINRRLAKSAKSTGWNKVAIQGDMQIMVDEIPYNLCGESRRWRADAMLAEAISFTAGIGMLVLDRVDVLAPDRRGALLDWVFELGADGYETVLLFATLKKKPELEGANVFWLEGGRVA
jgi:DNA repair exonuclease SbcCD ATPase subunit